MEESFQHRLPGLGEGLCGREQLPLEREAAGWQGSTGKPVFSSGQEVYQSLAGESFLAVGLQGRYTLMPLLSRPLWEHLSVCVFSCSVAS